MPEMIRQETRPWKKSLRVDASASMGAIMSLLLDAYQKRNKVAMVTFRQQEAWVNLPPTTSVELAGKLLAGKDNPSMDRLA